VGIFKSVGDFLFGKDPDIFDDNGNVVHKLPKRIWESWANRIKNDVQYNWRNHTGTRAGRRVQDNSKVSQ
jgi:hypothetical protein